MDIEWVIYHLTHNDDEDFTSLVDLDIDLCRSDQDQWDRLLIGLSRNRTVTSVELLRGYQGSVVNEDDLRRLFEALRLIPRLSKVKLDCFTTFDLEHSELLFRNNSTIEELWVENCHFHRDNTGSSSDEDNDIDNDHDGKDDDEGYNQYERFLGHLASIHRLRQLRIEMPMQLSRDAPLAHLLRCSSELRSVVLETSTARTVQMIRNATRRQNFADTMVALRSNETLETFDMDFGISFSEFKEVAAMLKHNNTLKELCLRLDASTAIINSIGEDSGAYLSDFHNDFNDSVQSLFEALKTNTNSSLRKFRQYNMEDRNFEFTLSKEGDNNSNRKKIVQKLIEIGLDMLECNLSLEFFSFFLFDLDFYRGGGSLREKKQLFLRLNQRGRKSVLHPSIRERVSKVSFIEQLAKHSIDDLDGLFYYISMNPSICKPPTEDAVCSAITSVISRQNGCDPKITGDWASSISLESGLVEDQQVVPQTKRCRFDRISQDQVTKP